MGHFTKRRKVALPIAVETDALDPAPAPAWRNGACLGFGERWGGLGGRNPVAHCA